jgi:hypothetical protein
LENRKWKLGRDPRCFLAALGIFVFGEKKKRAHHRGHGEHGEERIRKKKIW